MNEKIRPSHLERRAAVYLRQSTLKQVHEHRESTARQYALRQRAVDLGWAEQHVDVIDDDLGQSGTSVDWREGFQRLAEDVAHGRVGAIFAFEVSRLSRSSADWHRLLQLCGLAEVLLIDEQAIYSPSDYNDRLLLGLKGTMSEAEQYWMHLRLEGGRLSKARRGELFMRPPAGYVWDTDTRRFRLDPDEHVQRAVRLVFERFRLDGAAYSVSRYFIRHGLLLPTRGGQGELRWQTPSSSLILNMLHNPVYAGAYVFGRSEERLRLVNGQVRRRQMKKLPQEAWKACLRDHHPAYISWEEFMNNQRKVQDNRTKDASAHGRSAAREGSALLQGIVLCGRCGRRMHVDYSGPTRRPVYDCYPKSGTNACWNLPARPVDQAVAKLFLDVMKPPEIELGLALLRETEHQAAEIDRQWQLRRDRVCYEAQLAERRYKAVDPDNRVIARTLEREWNDKLAELEGIDREHQQVRQREKLELTEEDRARILSLAKDLPAVWNAPTTTHAERKNLLRMVVREVTLSPIDVPRRMTRVQVLWETGATSDFTVPRKDKYVALITPPKALALIRRFFNEKKPDLEIAKELNRRGLLTGRDQPWDFAAVRRVRYNHGMYLDSKKARRVPDQRADGLYSVHAVAARMNVPPSVVRYWARTGVLEPVERGRPGHPHWFVLDAPTLDRLKEARSKCHTLPSREEEDARATKSARSARPHAHRTG
jgi:DNA invertase Pin-like site-specific DNA recombinase